MWSTNRDISCYIETNRRIGQSKKVRMKYNKKIILRSINFPFFVFLFVALFSISFLFFLNKHKTIKFYSVACFVCWFCWCFVKNSVIKRENSIEIRAEIILLSIQFPFSFPLFFFFHHKQNILLVCLSICIINIVHQKYVELSMYSM